ncbi:MAG: GTP 3',8-cyclase MoaA, partial [Halobacteria archaeon]
VTNGALLAGRALELKAAGLDRVNISVDSLEPSVFREVRGGPLLPVLEGLRAALRVGLTPVKLNMVVMPRTLPFVDEMVDYVVSAGEPGALVLNLIQFMPERVRGGLLTVDMAQVHGRLARRSDRVEVREMHHRRVYHVGPAKIEVVDPYENPDFCAACHRLRLTADGFLKGCLNRDDDRVPVRGLNEAGTEAAFRRVVAERVPYYGGLLKRQADGSWRPAAGAVA